MRVRIFIDFWNLQLNWNRFRPNDKLDWERLPAVLMGEAQARLTSASLGNLTLEETRVYASYEAEKHGKLRGWLESFLDRLPGYYVSVKKRTWKESSIHCRECDTHHHECPSCAHKFGRAIEKGVDTQIVTDMLSLAWEQAYDVGLLVTSDKDFIPAVECLQSKNIKTVNAKWKGQGHQLAAKCWSSIDFDSIAGQLKR